MTGNNMPTIEGYYCANGPRVGKRLNQESVFSLVGEGNKICLNT